MNEHSKYNVFLPLSENYNAFNQLIFGYYDAATILFKEIRDGRGSIDTLTFPLFFCARHCIELQLKLLIYNMSSFNVFRKGCGKKIIAKGHNLKELYIQLNNLMNESENYDKRIKKYFQEVDVESLLSFFDAQDSSSQSFRYYIDKNGRRLLPPKFNILEPNNDFQLLCKFLFWIDEVIFECLKEYSTGTFTKKLSRSDLEEIAKLLPKKKDWDNNFFLEKKELIKKDYSLSNNDFSDAIDMITTNPYLCSLIGMEIPEEGFSNDFFHLYAVMM